MDKRRNWLLIIAGAPGSGKSTIARTIQSSFQGGEKPQIFEADNFCVGPDGKYRYSPEKNAEHHRMCQDSAEAALKAGKNVIVSNTFTRAWERRPYFEMADKAGADVLFLHAAGAFGNVHGVPADVVARMRAKYEELTPWESARAHIISLGGLGSAR